MWMYSDSGGSARKFTVCKLTEMGFSRCVVIIVAMQADPGKITGYRTGRRMPNTRENERAAGRLLPYNNPCASLPQW
jgi:hypothetical protein